MTPHEMTLRVRYAETDQMGVAYHSNYLIWMEVGRVEFFRAGGLRYRDFEERTGLHLAVVEAQVRYLAPARYDDPVIVRTSMSSAHRRMLALDYEMRHGESGQIFATGVTKHICLSRDTLKPAKLPTDYWPLFGIAG